ncbi:MAG: DUF2029 domain-containing protein [Acidobacteria bacterium]|nr:DUF2029 domain-containing protein [Acidobacteriota bacterium]
MYINAANLLISDYNIYTKPTHPVEDGGLFYIYPPLFAFLMIPLAFVPINLAIVFWCFLSTFLIGWTLKAFYEIISGSSFFELSILNRWVIGFFPILLTFRFIQHHLDRGQTNILILALTVLGLKIIYGKYKRAILGGAVIGFSAIIKPVSLPVAAYFVLRKRGKAMLGLICGALTGVLLPALYLGIGRNFELFRYWIDNYLLNAENRELHLGLEYNLSIIAQLYRFFTPAVAYSHNGTDYFLTIFTLPVETIHLIDWFCRILLVALIFVYWLKFHGKSEIVKKGLIALIFAIMPLLFPTAQKNYFVFLLPAYIYVVYLWHVLEIRNKWFRSLVIGSFIFASVTSDAILGDTLGDLFAMSGFVILGTLLLIGAIFQGASILAANETAEAESL